ncbi:hypothetical protein [Salipaludibacillus daqingensis]|uniref:hypothetical protein n=1 Tax=Salipaludibacillus daqingensis TaxID=3041001 RepID=UPI002474DAD3|nr:hypothetical protein [Salipaludibacillus daqingensis]
MNALQNNCPTRELLLKSIEELETSIVHYFEVSEKLIHAAQSIGSDQNKADKQKLMKIVLCLNAFFRHLRELQNLLSQKRTVIIFNLSQDHPVDEFETDKLKEKNLLNQQKLITYVQRNLDVIFNEFPFHQEMQLLTDQLEQLLEYYKHKKQTIYLYEEQTCPEPAPPLLNIRSVTNKSRKKKQ